MTYTPSTIDDSRPAEERDIPRHMRRYTATFAGHDELVTLRLPVDIKVATLVNDTDQALAFYLSKYDGTTDDPATALHTAGTSSLIDTVAPGATFPIAQDAEFNSIHLLPAAAATGALTIRVGAYGPEEGNGLANIETRAITMPEAP